MKPRETKGWEENGFRDTHRYNSNQLTLPLMRLIEVFSEWELNMYLPHYQPWYSVTEWCNVPSPVLALIGFSHQVSSKTLNSHSDTVRMQSLNAHQQICTSGVASAALNNCLHRTLGFKQKTHFDKSQWCGRNHPRSDSNGYMRENLWACLCLLWKTHSSNKYLIDLLISEKRCLWETFLLCEFICIQRSWDKKMGYRRWNADIASAVTLDEINGFLFITTSSATNLRTWNILFFIWSESVSSNLIQAACYSSTIQTEFFSVTLTQSSSTTSLHSGETFSDKTINSLPQNCRKEKAAPVLNDLSQLQLKSLITEFAVFLTLTHSSHLDYLTQINTT